MPSNSSSRRATTDRPLVLVNMAMTADGKIATANRSVSTFGSKADKENLFRLRATADAVMAGARTVDSAPVDLGPGEARFRRRRQRDGLAECNLRIVISGSASLSPDAAIFRKPISPIILVVAESAPARKRDRLLKLVDEVVIAGKREIDFQAVLKGLRKGHGVRRLVCEGGAALNDALIRADLVDELHLTVCPLIFGGRDAPTICDGLGLESLSRSRRFTLISRKRVGDEMFLAYRRESAES